MAKVSIKSKKISPFEGIFHVREHFTRFVGLVIDKVLELRCTSFDYQYSEIVRSLMSVYFCGGSCVEDVTLNFRKKGKLKNLRKLKKLRTNVQASKTLGRKRKDYCP